MTAPDDDRDDLGDANLAALLRDFGAQARGDRARPRELFEPPRELFERLREIDARQTALPRRSSLARWRPYALAASLAVGLGLAWFFATRGAEATRIGTASLSSSPTLVRGAETLRFASGSVVYVRARFERDGVAVLAMLDSAGGFAAVGDASGAAPAREVAAGAEQTWAVELDDQAGPEALVVLSVARERRGELLQALSAASTALPADPRDFESRARAVRGALAAQTWIDLVWLPYEHVAR